MFDASNRVSESSVVRNTSQNLLLYSEDFSQSSYTKIFSGIQDASQIVDPFGGNNAVRLAADTNNGQHRLDISTTVGTGSHTFSVYAKAADYGSIWLRRQGSSSVFNLENGTVISDSGNNSPSITDVGDGWYRVSITNTGSANDTFRINFAPTNSPTADYQGTNTSGIYIFGAMLEETVTYESTGTEKVTNGDFDTDTNWSKGTGWSIANGVAASDGSQSTNSGLIQYNVHTVGKKYTLTFDVVSTNGENIKFWVNGAQNIFTSALGVGTHTYTYTALHTGTAYFEATAAFVGSIDNVSIKEFDPIPSEYISTPVVSNDGLTFVESDLDSFVGGENLLDYSEDITNNWIKFGFGGASRTLVSSQTDPFGGTDATKIVLSNADTSTGGQLFTREFSAVQNQVYVLSVY